MCLTNEICGLSHVVLLSDLIISTGVSLLQTIAFRSCKCQFLINYLKLVRGRLILSHLLIPEVHITALILKVSFLMFVCLFVGV